MNRILLSCPTFVTLERKTKKDKKIAINLNQYRNLHYIVENKAKKAFKEEMREQLEGLKIDTPVNITYKVYKASNRKLDKMNVISILSKYLMDAITEFGCWPDDNDEIIKEELLLPTELDRDNPRVEVIISSLDC